MTVEPAKAALRKTRRAQRPPRKFCPLCIEELSPPLNVCSGCGSATHEGRLCQTCGREVSGEKLIQLAKRGRVVAQSQRSQAKRSASQTRHEAQKRAWHSKPLSAWPDEKTYLGEIQPRLSSITISALSSALGICESYAADIRAGRRRPHPRHWELLAELVGISNSY